MRLKNRTVGIPRGFRFQQPETGWDSVTVLGKHPSWEALVNAVIAMRNANPHQRDKHQWAVDVVSVANEVDAYNAKICLDNGWNNFLITVDRAGYGPPPPPIQPVSAQVGAQLRGMADKARKIWAGVKTLNNWLDSGEPPVPNEQYLSRAQTCIACPLNGKGDFTRFFTIPASDSIKRQIARMHEMAIAGSLDEQLGVCEACLCPLVLKTQTPIQFIKPQMNDGMVDSLRKGKDCWVLSELT